MTHPTEHTIQRALKWVSATLALLIGLLGAHRLLLKATLPFEFRSVKDIIFIAEDYGENIRVGDILQAIDQVPINKDFQIEFLLDGKRPGEIVSLLSSSGGVPKEVRVTLVSTYPDRLFILVSLLIGVAFWGTALFVVIKNPRGESPWLLFWLLNLFAVAIMTSPGNYSASPAFVGPLLRAAHDISYMMGIAIFVHFTVVFPQRKWKRLGVFLTLVYTSAIFLSTALAVTDVLAVSSRSVAMAARYISWRWVLHLFLVAGVVGGLVILLHSFLKLRADSERKKIQWILWGTVVAASPFLVLQIVPGLFTFRALVREEISLAFLLIIPISFGIAVVKYHVFDIEVLIRRSIVYSLLTATVVLFYFAVVAVVTALLGGIVGESRQFFSLVAAFSVAVLFNPARRRIQRFVDRTCYRVRYDFRQAVHSLTNAIKESVTIKQLGQLVVERLDELIPLEKVALITVTEPGHRMKMIAHRGLDIPAKHIPSLRVEQITTEMKLPVARPEKVESGIPIDAGMAHVFERWGISVALPLVLLPRQIVGVIVLGDKRSGMKYSSSDLDLLMTIASQIAVAVERLQLQEQLILGEMEKRRLEEVNQLKSEFVSSVSHELRTPLTSIQMFAETLLSREIRSQKKRNEYLKIIHGESERLTRLINNVLDFAKIERGVKQYTFEPTDVKEVVADVLRSMEYQFTKLGFRVKARMSEKIPQISADRDAISEAVMNLLSNSMKYSGKRHQIEVRLTHSAQNIVIEVKDYGVGIPMAELPNIFEPFYRVREGKTAHAAGAGLGLALVKHIMEAHGGEVRVESKVGKGSTFSLLFPIKGA